MRNKIEILKEKETIIQELCSILIEIIGDEEFTYLGMQDILVLGNDCNKAIALVKKYKKG